MARSAALVAATAFGLAALATSFPLGSRSWRLPDRWNPWAPLAVADVPNLLTRWKLARLDDRPQACAATLASSGLRYERVPDRSLHNGCGWTDAVLVLATPTRLSRPFVLQCPAAVALALWERHSVQPLARELLGSAVVRIDHFGSYACRNIGHAADGRRSEHARADALDVAGFVLADGRAVRVLGDWRGDGARARFLHAVHDGACDFWNVVLGPDYNAAHRDHLHLDRGPYRACR